jgi:hypothetical protein
MEPMAKTTTPLRPSPPPGAGVDLDPARRPGVPREREPRPWPHTRYPPVRMEGEPAVSLHGRPGKRMPPVFSTALPLRGVSGRIRALGYRYPDHRLRHWLLILAGDRVESAGARITGLARMAAPGLLAVLGMRVLGMRRARKRRREEAAWSTSAREAWGT